MNLSKSKNRAEHYCDTVLFTSYAGTEIKVDGKEYMIMNESDILAIIEG